MADLPDRDKLLRNFGRCANWEEKYLYIIELGQRLPPLSEEAHNPDNIIQGCQSQVWILMQQTDGCFRVVFDELLHHGHRRIGGTIVDNDHFMGHHGLPSGIQQAIVDTLLFIPSGDDN